MDDSGLRERVEGLVNRAWGWTASPKAAAGCILALVDAEYRPLLEELADYKAYYEWTGMTWGGKERREIVERIEARRSHDRPTDGT